MTMGTIKVGIVKGHGIAAEIIANPPPGIRYIPLTSKKHFITYVINAPASYKYFYNDCVDIIEAPIFPIVTKQPWIYTPADTHTFMSFKILGLPFPRILRSVIVKYLFERDNFIRLIFKSEAGRRSLNEYPFLLSEKILSKTEVIYPPIRKVDDKFIRFNNDKINILFSGPIISKGGLHVIDAFEQLQKEFKNIKLRLCSGENFNTKNYRLIKKYKEKIRSNKDIVFGWVNRAQLLNVVLPETDIFVCPTYKDSYGYAIAEAMAFGIPVIATDYFAIPEIVEHGESGFLIKITNEPFIQKLRGYVINDIPSNFYRYMNREVYKYLKLLIMNFDLRKKMGMRGLKIAREKFSFEKRNKLMVKIYREAILKKKYQNK